MERLSRKKCLIFLEFWRSTFEPGYNLKDVFEKLQLIEQCYIRPATKLANNYQKSSWLIRLVLVG